MKKRDQKQKEKQLPFKEQKFVKGTKKDEDDAKKGTSKKVKEPVSDTSSVRTK